MKKKRRNKKKSQIPTLLVGTAIGTLAGLALAKKSGKEFLEELEQKFDIAKEKAIKTYENKEEIIDTINRNINKVTKMEIKHFDEPEYYSKEFSD